jgi:hypothetical protein
VYDFGSLPSDGLKYNISLPVDFRRYVHHCGEKEMTARVRAVLSWNTPSSATDPDAPVVWGNSLESMILIPFVKTVQAGNWIPSLAAPGDTDIEGSGCVPGHSCGHQLASPNAGGISISRRIPSASIGGQSGF